ncbi:SRPBCC domain-containing protein [Pseudonocardia sp.]|uniref:SRPBCC domain-containing protein n=1 Tax=Pseudonocardia sp. TaxID=60912 RepID=UPI00261F3C3B|nr:SRPBCC domain-containing protein [Pseudonocardia sp.]
MIDVTHEISAGTRTVGSRTLAAGEARVVTITRTYPTDLDDLWDACTTAGRIARWLGPVDGDLRPGGRYRLEGNAEGTVEHCDPPHGFSATWEFGGEVSWIELRLAPVDAVHTRFTLEHVAHVDDERWAEFGPGAAGVGWDLALLGLGLHLGDPAGRFDEETWAASEEGRRFVAASGAAWFAADVVSGTDEAGARAAADRTITFYSATPA